MSRNGLVIVGASGQGRMAFQIAQALDLDVAGFVDGAYAPGTELLDRPVLAREPEDCSELKAGSPWFIAVGNNGVREALATRAEELSGRAGTSLVHPSALLAPGTVVGDGVFVAPGAVVNIGSRLEHGCILNTRASVDHDGVLEAFSQVCPGVTLAGDTVVGRRAFVGTGACTIPGMRIGADAVVGAGAVVIRHVDEGTTVVGVPARPR